MVCLLSLLFIIRNKASTANIRGSCLLLQVSAKEIKHFTLFNEAQVFLSRDFRNGGLVGVSVREILTKKLSLLMRLEILYWKLNWKVMKYLNIELLARSYVSLGAFWTRWKQRPLAHLWLESGVQQWNSIVSCVSPTTVNVKTVNVNSNPDRRLYC